MAILCDSTCQLVMEKAAILSVAYNNYSEQVAYHTCALSHSQLFGIRSSEADSYGTHLIGNHVYQTTSCLCHFGKTTGNEIDIALFRNKNTRRNGSTVAGTTRSFSDSSVFHRRPKCSSEQKIVMTAKKLTILAIDKAFLRHHWTDPDKICQNLL